MQDATHDRTAVRGESLRHGCGLRLLADRTVIVLRGQDAKGWLQGQATQDLRPLNPGGSSAFCLCSATGQLRAICQVWALHDRLIVTTESSTAAALSERVEHMVILEDVRSSQPPVELWSLQGPGATAALSRLADPPKLDAGDAGIAGAPVALLRSMRTPKGGWDIVAPLGSAVGAALRELAEETAGADWRAAEIEAGIPRFGIDADAKTLPPELGPAFEEAHISYAKGCYMGQEVLMRMHSRGHTNRTWRGLLTADRVEAGATVEHPARKDAGRVTSACTSPAHGPIATAMLRNEAARVGDRVIIHHAGAEIEAEVLELPFP